jgi:Cft2 family RNA processing exonuclease
VQFDDQSVLRGARFPDFSDEPLDLLVIECTRGDSPSPEGFSRAAEAERFLSALQETFERGGSALVPSFALGKTQELLGMLHGFRRKGALRKDCPIYIGGLGAKITEIYDAMASQTPRLRPGLQLLDEVAPFILAGREASDVPIRGGRIYGISSGMMTEKTLSNLFVRRIIGREDYSVLFIGYADPDSPGGRLRAAKRGDYVALGEGEEPERVSCHVDAFQFSAHASRERLLEYITRVRPKSLALVHGDPGAVEGIAAAIRSALPEVRVEIPPSGVTLMF